MAADVDPKTDTDLELLDAAREADLATVTATHDGATSEQPAGELAAEQRDESESASGPAVRKEAS
jgi:hypothetical protein